VPSPNTWPLIRSPRFGEVWLKLEPSVAAEPSRLRGRSEEMVCATIAVLATFPAARVM